MLSTNDRAGQQVWLAFLNEIADESMPEIEG